MNPLRLRRKALNSESTSTPARMDHLWSKKAKVFNNRSMSEVWTLRNQGLKRGTAV